MHLVIVGPGALGSLLAARISLYLDSGAEKAVSDLHLTLLDHRPARTQYLAGHGLILEQDNRQYRTFPEITDNPAVSAGADVFILCVKAAASAATLERIRPYLTSRQILLSAQNGISHLDLLLSLPCSSGVAVTSEGATLLAPGHVRHGGVGLTRLGLLCVAGKAADEHLAQLSAVLNNAGLAAEITPDPLRYVWAKLLVNVGINALTAIHGCTNGELLESENIRKTMAEAVREAQSVARANHIRIEGDPVAATYQVCRMTGSNISSMYQDVRNRRGTEIDAINGAVVFEGERHNIPTPVNRELVRLVREIEKGYEKNGGAVEEQD